LFQFPVRRPVVRVERETVRHRPGELSHALHGRERSLAPATCERVRDERRVEERLDDAADGVVDHPAAERRGNDAARLRVADLEDPVRAEPVRSVRQLGPDAVQLRFEAEGQPLHPRLAALAAARIVPRGKKVLERGDRLEEMAGACHDTS
jgi:hypothetical protein